MTSNSLRLSPLLAAPLLAAACAPTPSESLSPGVRRLPTLFETEHCSVELTKLSYDDPGADDAEFLELRVRLRAAEAPPPGSHDPDRPPHANRDAESPSHAADGGATSVGPCGSESDSGMRTDADPEVNSGPEAGSPAGWTLAACGLTAIELLNGGNDSCAVYRSIDLAEVTLPEAGFVTVCSDESAHAAACTVTRAGAARLRNGWIQNGPADGLRFIGADGESVAEFTYEGANPTCFSGEPKNLVEESGEMTGRSGASEDDINVSCDGAFVLQSADQAPLGQPADCGTRRADAASGRDDAASGDPVADAAGSFHRDAKGSDSEPSSDVPTARYQPPVAASGAEPIIVPDAGLPGYDAGLAERPTAAVPGAPGCAMSAPPIGSGFVGGWGAAALFWLVAARARGSSTLRQEQRTHR